MMLYHCGQKYTKHFPVYIGNAKYAAVTVVLLAKPIGGLELLQSNLTLLMGLPAVHVHSFSPYVVL